MWFQTIVDVSDGVGARSAAKTVLVSAFLLTTLMLVGCMPDSASDRERAESLIEALDETDWTQAEPYGLSFESTGTDKAGLEDSVGAVGLSSLVETEEMSGGVVNITYLVFEDYERASAALGEYMSRMEDVPELERGTPTGQSRFCADFGGQDECGAVSQNVMVIVLSRLEMLRREDEPHTEELVALALSHLREVRNLN